MSDKHLKTNDPFPDLPADDGKLRLLTMRFCPYAQRVHLVLDAKCIAHHTINIDLIEKPRWLTQYSPLGKVPALSTNDQSSDGTPYLIESLKIADYLDEKYPKPVRLHSADSDRETEDRLWVDRFDAVIMPFFAIVLGGGNGGELVKMLNALDSFEVELKRRGDDGYFGGGERPGMLDYMIWPWIERLGALKELVGKDVADQYAIRVERFPSLIKWRSRMFNDRAVQVTALSTDVHVKYYQLRKANSENRYDFLLD